ncbi:hypothetical protein VPH35_128783 [Triticum aestivum]
MSSPAPRFPSSGDGDRWMTVKSRKDRRTTIKAANGAGRPSAKRFGRRSAINGRGGKEAFLSRFNMLYFRCLNSSHRRIDCRDPLHCIIYKQSGHYGRECPLPQVQGARRLPDPSSAARPFSRSAAFSFVDSAAPAVATCHDCHGPSGAPHRRVAPLQVELQDGDQHAGHRAAGVPLSQARRAGHGLDGPPCGQPHVGGPVHRGAALLPAPPAARDEP